LLHGSIGMTESTTALPPSEYRVRQVLPQLLVVGALVALRLIAYSSAGGLWRDEVHSVNVATMPANDLFFVLTNDSLPMCWQSLLRSWIALFGNTDASVRVLGLLIGLATIPAMWWSARQFGIRFPWWMMVLLGLDPSLIVFGGEVRGYGLGIIGFLIMIGTAWRTLQHPSAWGWFELTIASLFAVQSLFTNCFLLAAAFIACGLVAVRQGRFRVCLGFMLIGLLAAASMVPYALYVAPRLTRVVSPVHDPTPLFLPWKIFVATYKWGGTFRFLLWLVIGGVGFIELLRRISGRNANRSEESTIDRDLVAFLPAFFWIGTFGFWFYMRYLGVQTAHWYHIPWLALLALTTELGMGLWLRHHPQRQPLIVGLACCACIIIACEVTPRVRYRLTTTDLIARDLSKVARSGDLVVVTPWYVGITFGRYYQGDADWTNLPNVDYIDHHLGCEEMKEKVMPLPAVVAIEKELQKIESTLARGGKVWWVGPMKRLPAGQPPLMLGGAPDPKYGWRESAYMSSWQQIAIARMQSMGVTIRERTTPEPRGVNPCENSSVFVVERVPQRPSSELSIKPTDLPR